MLSDLIIRTFWRNIDKTNWQNVCLLLLLLTRIDLFTAKQLFFVLRLPNSFIRIRIKDWPLFTRLWANHIKTPPFIYTWSHWHGSDDPSNSICFHCLCLVTMSTSGLAIMTPGLYIIIRGPKYLIEPCSWLIWLQ